MKKYTVRYVDGWLHPDAFEVEADTKEGALEKANAVMNAATLDQNGIQAIEGVEEAEPEWEVVIPSERFILGCSSEFEALKQLDHAKTVLGCSDAYVNKHYPDRDERY